MPIGAISIYSAHILTESVWWPKEVLGILGICISISFPPSLREHSIKKELTYLSHKAIMAMKFCRTDRLVCCSVSYQRWRLYIGSMYLC